MTAFDARKDSPTLRAATAAFTQVLFDDLLPTLRLAARGCGYALTTHGTGARDLDLVAIPWVDSTDDPELLVARLCGVLSGCLGRAFPMKDWAEKPHGRKAVTIITPGGLCPEIDLSIMPTIKVSVDGQA